MIDLQWLSDRLCEALRWQLAHPGRDDGPQVPWAGRRIWAIFLALDGARGSNGFGALPIGWPEIDAWSRVNREPVRPWEAEIIRAMDGAYLEYAYQRAAQGRQEAMPRRSSAPLTPALFDAMFG